MTRQDRGSSSKKSPPQNSSPDISPDEVLDTVDPGDDTQHRFRYQHAYGVILLLAALSDKKPYTALWCEHHEDLLGQRDDGTFDAYQIKTRRSGRWNLSDDPLRDSIKRFVEEDQRFPEKIKEFLFVSNSDAPYEDSDAPNKVGRSPKKFLQAVKHASFPSDLTPPFNTVFEELSLHCHCEPLRLMTVLKKLDFLSGPGLDSFEAEIAQHDLSAILECRALSAKALEHLLDELIAKVYKASCRSISDPRRHWYGLNKGDRDNPRLQAKRITVESILTFIRENQLRLLDLAKDVPVLHTDVIEVLDFYLLHSFEEDQVAKLDQAGETDPKRMTPLHQVFIDLELKPRSDQPRPPLEHSQLSLFTDLEQTSNPQGEQVPEILSSAGERPLSAMDCFLKEVSSKIVIIGGPGQGKSTLGQYLAQVHRAILLNRQQELLRDISGGSGPQRNFQPRTVRLPFRIVLKDFAQWLADDPPLDTVEAYIAEQIGKGASRPGEVNEKIFHTILKARPTLLVLDGLDEITEEALCNRMITCIERFLARTERLRANMQVIATSRPTSYRDQFTPRLFWHLELQPLSEEKVREYAACWTHIKVPKDEQRRVKETLEECLRENHTRPLLTTPLQVTIILLIIKDGGKPPSQREELFQRYWSRILDREKAKAKGIIRTGDTRLFGLHAYLGYLLHRNAAGKNVRSLFPTDEFEQIVRGFLQSTDSVSSPEAIQRQAAQMVNEARTRLVLLVEPKTGFFGFELRSLQEFFAGAYLVQTASNTEQRFARLRAIAYSEHWRNVALFCAGRIVRDFGGEAANILEEVCRPIDRIFPDIYIHRGAWFALDIAADGIFTTNNRNLQDSALELALSVLHTGMTSQGQSHLNTALQQLSQEDRSDILSKLLRRKLTFLPLSCLPPALELYGKYINTKSEFIQALEVLFSTDKREYVLKALNIGFQRKVDPKWLALRLERYCHLWISEQEYSLLNSWWAANSQYTQKVLFALPLSEDQASSWMDHLLALFPQYGRRYREVGLRLIENPETYSQQIVAVLQCLHIIGNYLHPFAHIQLELGRSLRIRYPSTMQSTFTTSVASASPGLLAILDQLIQRSDLMPQLKICLWVLYWQIHEPTETMVTIFLNESRAWSGNQTLLGILSRTIRPSLPLLVLALESQMKNDQDIEALLQPHLNVLSLCQRVHKALKEGLNKLPREEQFAAVLCRRYTKHHFPELASIAEQLQTDSNRLVEILTDLSIDSGMKLSSVVLQRIFSYIEEDLVQSQSTQLVGWVFAACNWELDPEVAQQGTKLLQALVERLPQRSDIIIPFILKLLSFDTTPLFPTSATLPYLANKVHAENVPRWVLSDAICQIPEEHLISLASFTTHEDPQVRQEAITFWATLIEIVLDGAYGDDFKMKRLKLEALSFDCNISLSLIRGTDRAQRKKGIMLLTYSHIPIGEEQYFAALWSAMPQAQNDDEIGAWALFLKNVPVGKSEKKAWQKLLETVLDTPQNCSSSVLAAAMERYTELAGVAGSKIKSERALGLPVLTPPKSKALHNRNMFPYMI